VPTFGELGFKDPLFETSIWLGLLGPAKLPPDITQRLYQEFKAIINQPDVAKQIRERGLIAIGSSPGDFERSYRSDFELITKRIREFGVEPQ
jgi:tripartite-type tricarboxylate transporter receptor subunit TctC